MAWDTSIAISSVAALIAIWAAFESHRANTYAAEANQIAERANELSEQSNKHALKANEIGAQAHELAERLAPAPLSALIQVSKNKWALVNQSGRPIELLSISEIPGEAKGLMRVKQLPQTLEHESKFSLFTTEVMSSGGWKRSRLSDVLRGRRTCNVLTVISPELVTHTFYASLTSLDGNLRCLLP